MNLPFLKIGSHVQLVLTAANNVPPHKPSALFDLFSMGLPDFAFVNSN